MNMYKDLLVSRSLALPSDVVANRTRSQEEGI